MAISMQSLEILQLFLGQPSRGSPPPTPLWRHHFTLPGEVKDPKTPTKEMTMSTTTSSTRKNLLRVILPTLAAGYLGLYAPGSRAADAVPGYEPTAKMVQYGDLNLATAQGVERLYQRIVGAANEVCDAHGDRSLENMARFQMCIRESIRSAVAAAGVPQLSTLYASKIGQPKKGSPALAQR